MNIEDQCRNFCYLSDYCNECNFCFCGKKISPSSYLYNDVCEDLEIIPYIYF